MGNLKRQLSRSQEREVGVTMARGRRSTDVTGFLEVVEASSKSWTLRVQIKVRYVSGDAWFASHPLFVSMPV